MSKVEDLLTAEEEAEIVEAIRLAESKTSGEIRVHIERSSKLAHYDRALEIFHLLKMDNTKLQNGVLFYLAVNDKQFVIIGDKGIDTAVPDNFWESTRDVVLTHFKNDDFKLGLVAGISIAGQQLQQYFPWEHDDTDELSNEISRE